MANRFIEVNIVTPAPARMSIGLEAELETNVFFVNMRGSMDKLCLSVFSTLTEF